ncbi:hypothetical protein [Deinococcus hopiensis]|uniref:Uncharacterized protein n=1 Tax=Deinococcus hopiensis KR-140 TaxID=695939 RepID=A0A1W1VH70_9DEIO|nr:hypothetical protein [Deinococcus hopiensis]SMB92583.1 hypothetical protein SAMN00790413_01645 [Deinococcus hopiensis KR-140]
MSPTPHPALSPLTLRWMPGTSDRVHFEKGGRTFTVLLRDVQRSDAHSLNPLYLRGRVTLGVTRVHLADLMGPLRQHVSRETTGTAAGAWVEGGGRADEEPQDQSPI